MEEINIIIMCVVVIILMVAFMSGCYYACVKADLYKAEKMIELYQEKNIIDEDTKKILIQGLDIN